MTPPPDPLRSNFKHLYADVAWYGVLAGSTIAFLNIYAARLGADAFQIGLLSAGPAVMNLLFSLPAGGWLQERSFIVVTFWTSVVQRLGFLMMAFLPWLFDESGQVAALVGVTLAMSAPATLLSISFNAVLAETVPMEYRAEVVGRRNALLAVTMTVSTLVSGRLLDVVVFPLNYQIVFALGAVGAFLSSYHLGRLVDSRFVPAFSLSRRGQKTDRSVRAAKTPNGHAAILNPDLLRGGFALFIGAYFCFYTFQYLGWPLFPIAMVDTLQLSDGMISLGNGLFYGAMFLVSLRLNSLARRFGHQQMLAVSAMGFAIYPLLLGLARGVSLFLLASLIGGVVWGLLNASLINRLMERVPEDRRAAGMAFHNLALNLGILVGSVLGPALSTQIGNPDALLVIAGLRVLAGVLFLRWG